MTNAELIAKIKAEVERRKTIQLKRIQEGDLVDSAPYDKNEAYNEILSFLSTLESEKPMELEEEISRTYHDGSVADTSDLDHVSYENIAHHFYELGCRRTAEKYDEIEYNRQRAEESPLPEDTVLFNKGVEEGKRLMMKEAVEGEVFIANADYKEAIISVVVENTKLDYLETGDKVKIIIVKE